MNFESLVTRISDKLLFAPTDGFESDEIDESQRVVFSRWVQAGKIIRIRNGLYTLAGPYRKRQLHPFIIANAIRRDSYVSLESALSFHGISPPQEEPVVTSVSPGRPESLDTPFGRFVCRHIKRSLLFGHRNVAIAENQFVRIASPEKAILDFLYYHPECGRWGGTQRFPLQRADVVDIRKLIKMGQETNSNTLRFAVARLSLRLKSYQSKSKR
jgi:predicted transcriptional regulator of viral defense system